MQSRKIFPVGGYDEYTNWMFPTALVDNVEEADLVCFCGGSDVDNSLYNEPRNPTTHSDLCRDLYEKHVFELAKSLNRKMIGICRGNQFLGVMNGARLVQNQANPSFLHPMTTHDGKTLIVSSTHHQSVHMWNLPDDHYKLLGWTVGMSAYHEDGNRHEMVIGKVPGNREVEMVYYPKTQCLGVQQHPEMLHGDFAHAPMISYMRSLLDGLLAGTL